MFLIKSFLYRVTWYAAAIYFPRPSFTFYRTGYIGDPYREGISGRTPRELIEDQEIETATLYPKGSQKEPHLPQKGPGSYNIKLNKLIENITI